MGFERLKKNAEFQRVYKRGKSFGCKNLVLYYMPNGTHKYRAGFSVSKKVGNAVTRNRLRRYLKEALILLEPSGRGYDLIFIARPVARDHSFHEIYGSVRYLFKKVGLEVYEHRKKDAHSRD